MVPVLMCMRLHARVCKHHNMHTCTHAHYFKWPLLSKTDCDNSQLVTAVYLKTAISKRTHGPGRKHL